jgi:hypothetical protein
MSGTPLTRTGAKRKRSLSFKMESMAIIAERERARD